MTSTTTIATPPSDCTPEPHSLNILLSLSLILLLTLTCLTPPTTAITLADRIRAINNTSPVSTVLRQDTTAQDEIRPTFDFIHKLVAIQAKREKEDHNAACNLSPDARWPGSADNYLNVFGLGNLNESSPRCFAALDLSTALTNRRRSDAIATRADLRNALSVLRRSREALFHAAARMPLPKTEDWRDAHAPYSLVSEVHRRGEQTCAMEQLHAFRKGDVWYIRAGMTNHQLYRFMPDFRRQMIYEWVAPAFNHSLRFPLPELLDNSTVMPDATTIVASWPGRGVSFREAHFDDPESPIAQAYQQNFVTADLAADAVTISNMAILALPLAMNAIPVAFIADLNSVGMLLYVLVTDLFSVAPFFIKGVELIRSSQLHRPVVFANIAGSESDFGMLHVWAVDCMAEGGFRTAGIIFVVIAVLALVAGVSLEVWASNWMRQRKQRVPTGHMEKEIPGPFGPVFMEASTKGLLGSRETAIENEYLREAEWWEEQYVRMSGNRQAGSGYNSEGSASQPSSFPTRRWPVPPPPDESA